MHLKETEVIGMSPRYCRTNRRYKVKTPKEKMSFEKKLAIKSIVSICLLSLLALASLFIPKEIPIKVLYKTYTLKDWKDILTPAVATVKGTSLKVIKTYTNLIDKAEKSFGIEPHKEGTVKALTTDAKDEKDSPPVEKTNKGTQNASLKWQPPVWAEVSSPFGERIHPINDKETMHTGVDLAAVEGTVVVAAASGTVSAVGYDDANGNYVIIDHGNGITSVYAHLFCSCVSVGDLVSPEIKIAEVGSTGISTGPHLHFEIKENGKSVNPANYVYFKE